MVETRTLDSLTPKKIFDYWHTDKEGGAIVSNGMESLNLGRVGGDIWKLINGKTNISTIAQRIAEKYREDFNDVAIDTAQFLADLANTNTIILDSGPLYKLGKTNPKLTFSWKDIYVTNTDGPVDVLFITPPSPLLETNMVSHIYNASCLGIGYLYALAEQKCGLKVGYLDLWGAILTERDLKIIFSALSPRILAISAMTENIQNGQRIAAFFKAATCGEGLVLVGGPHVTFRYQEVLADPAIDFCFLGEAESSFCEFLQTWIRQPERSAYKAIQGLAFLLDGECCTTSAPLHEAGLDHLPFPQLVPRYVKEKGVIPIITARGCPFGCKFCAAGELSGNRYRLRSVDSVIAEMVHQWKLYGVNHFSFMDDTISIIPKRLIEFCARIKKSPIPDCKWVAESRVDVLAQSPELARIIKDAGCHGLQLGIEGGTDEKLLLIGKRTNVKSIHQAIQNCLEVGLKITGSMVIGVPGESRESIEYSIKFASFLKQEYKIAVYLAWFIPYPGTFYDRNLEALNCTRRHGCDYELHSTLTPNILNPGDNLDDLLNLHFDNFLGVGNTLKKPNGNTASSNFDFLKFKESFILKENVFESTS